MLVRTRTWVLGSVLLSGLGLVAACSAPGDSNVSASSATPAAAAGTPSWAKAANYRGRVPAGATVGFQVHLAMRNLDAAKAELAAVSDPDSAQYGKFLSDADFEGKYAPTSADVAAVRAHFEAQGMRVTEVPGNRAYVAVEGAASQVEQALSTRLGHFEVNGELRRAPLDPVKLPAAVSSRVSTLVGLTTHRMESQMALPADVSPEATTTPRICTEYMGQILDTTDPPFGGGYASPLSYVQCGYKPAQLRALYGLNTMVRKGTDGTGQKIAIVDAWTPPTLVQDAQTYFANEDADYPLDTSQITLLQGPGTAQKPDPGWYGESTLDVEAVHAIAPAAKIVYVGAASNADADLIAAINLIVTQKSATLISNSYGGIEAESYGTYTAWQSIAIQAGLKGIGLYFASGDAGDNAAHDQGLGPSPLFPGSLAEVTGVGGTSLAMGSTGQRLFEAGWETGVSRLVTPVAEAGADAGAPYWNPGPPGGWYFGAGGGASAVYLEPAWQKGIVPDTLANWDGAQARVSPDVSMLGDPETGYIIGQTSPTSGTYGELTIGGTSLATPLFTATVALAQQNAKRTFGAANALFYKASKKGAFTDIVAPATPQAVAGGRGGVVITFDVHGTTNTNVTAVGFDTVTGLGVPNASKFFSTVK